jgi:hypothetical protein
MTCRIQEAAVEKSYARQVKNGLSKLTCTGQDMVKGSSRAFAHAIAHGWYEAAPPGPFDAALFYKNPILHALLSPTIPIFASIPVHRVWAT